MTGSSTQCRAQSSKSWRVARRASVQNAMSSPYDVTGIWGAYSPPGWAPYGVSTTASTRWAGILTRCPRPSRRSTTRSTVATTPRRAAQAPQAASSNGSDSATFPSRSATAPCTKVTSGASGARSPTGPNAVSTTLNCSLDAIDDPWSDPVTMAGSPRAAASRRWVKVRIDQCSTSTAPYA